jgi:hypothetical protein
MSHEAKKIAAGPATKIKREIAEMRFRLSCRFFEFYGNVVCPRRISRFLPVAAIAISAYISVVIGITVGHVGNFAKMVMIADSYHTASIIKLDPLVVPSPILRFHRSAPLEHLAYQIEQISDF